MAQEKSPASDEAPVRRKRHLARRILVVLLLVVLAALAVIWLRRDQIAQQLITDTLHDYGIEARYDIESIGPDAQVLRNIVIGDPANPDLTIERAELRLSAQWGMPGVSQLIVEKPRLFGRFVGGQLSFGALDPLIFTGSEEAFEFPDMQLTLVDGRALIEGDLGPVALRMNGAGHLRGGFSAELAGVAPSLAVGTCQFEAATLYGQVSIDAERPGFTGPLRFDQLSCADAGVQLASGALTLDMQADRNLAGFEGQAGLQAGKASLAANSIASMAGKGRFTFRGGDLTTDFEVEGRDLRSAAVNLALVEMAGRLRGREEFAKLELNADISARNILPGQGMDTMLSNAIRSAEGTLAAPLLAKFRQQLAGELRGSTLAADLSIRSEEGQLAIVVPEARIRGRSGASVMALSRGQMAFANTGLPLFSGNFATGGEGLPQIAGRMEQDAGAPLELRMQMREYSAGNASLALPDLRVQQARNGALSLVGSMRASGPLPGGFAQGLTLPLSGTVAPDGAVSMWASCTDIGFDSLAAASLRLERQRLTLCPPPGRSILRYDNNGLSIAAGAPSLAMGGMLGETPLRLSSGPIGFAWPGAMSAREIDVVLGPQGSAARFKLSDLSAQLGDEIAGTFSGADIGIDAVPLDVLQAQGEWRFSDGVFSLANASFELEDREADDRFEPLEARGAVLTLADNQIDADFTLYHPASGTKVVKVAMAHDLDTAAGHADLLVDALTFRPGFQPADLTSSLYGTVSLVSGTVYGQGQVNWTADAITSGGSFSSDGLDLAAAFGPVKGAKGTVIFTDLLALTTAPSQRIFVESINPGIEVLDGEIAISLTDATKLSLEQAHWPFLGGTLTMRPITLSFGAEEVRRYVLEIEGLDAQRFVEHMELNNISATGIFDGTIPVVFDELGNGSLQGGMLVSRAPGGTVSYVGDLTYEDLSPIANYAFDALRALEYDRMQIGVDGSLTGELITSVRFDGVRQGEGTQSNFVTRRLANLPIRFIVNIRAPFYTMMTNLRSLYDPSAVRDPRGLGLLEDNGTRFVPGNGQAPATPTDEPDIQPPESEAMP